MGIFDEICVALQSMGFTVTTVKPNSFPPGMIFVHLSDLDFHYETNMTAHMPVMLRIDWVEDSLNTVDDKVASVILVIERRLAQAIPSAVGTFKFRKPDIIHLGTAIKVSLKCTYTKVIDI